MFCVIDSHCDSIQKTDLLKNPLVKPYNYSQKHPHLQFVAMFCGWPKEDSEASCKRAEKYTGLFNICAANEDFAIVKTYADIEKAFAEGRNASLLTVEGATGYMGSVDIFRKFYNAGVRVTGLAWLSNDLASSNREEPDSVADTGITEKGRAIVEEGNRLGMIFDVSHLSDKSFWQLAELSEKPIIASHSNFRALCGHSRNLTDDMAKQIIRRGGMIGLNLCTSFIDDNKENQTVDRLLDHLDHCLELGGENCIGFGGDIDGIDRLPAPLNEETSIHDQILDAMYKRGYSEELIRKVSFENYMAYLKKYL